MSVNINKVMLAGNLTRDPEVKSLANEQHVAKFSLAMNRKFKSGDEMKEEVTFVECEAWGRTAELVGQYLAKGRSCFVEGRLKLDSWEDKEGKKRSSLKVVADSVQFLDSKGAKTDGEQSEAPAAKVTHRQVPADIGGGAGSGEEPFHHDLGSDAWG